METVEYIDDAYEEMMKMVKNGKLSLIKYEDFIKRQGQWLEQTIIKEYKNATNPPYKHYLEVKFPKYIKKVKNEEKIIN